jgi:hypothetical protein
MGILETIRRNIRRSSRSIGYDKESLTIVSTCDDTIFADDNQEESYFLFSHEPLSPHPGEITTTSFAIVSKQRKKRPCFEEESDRLLSDIRDAQKEDYFNFSPSDDEERDDVRLLGSSDTDNNRSLAYSFEQYEEEIIFEPSFEVALMDPDAFSFGPIEGKTGGDSCPRAVSASNDDIFPLPLCKHRAQKRYDLYGRPFVHIFHEGLTTLYEESEDLKSRECNVPDEDAARNSARWELALEEMEKKDFNYEWDGIIPQRCGNRSAYEI